MLPLPQICAQECSKGLYVKLGQILLGVVSTLLQFCGILAIRETRRVGKFLSETDYCGTVNVLSAADTDQDPKCRVNESLYARRV